MKKLIAYINAENETSERVAALAASYENLGADELLIYNHTENEAEREEFLELARVTIRAVDIPVMVGCYVKRFEDIKKAIYTGAWAVLLRYRDIKNTTLLKEGTDRFGEAHVYVEADMGDENYDGFYEDMKSGLIDSSLPLVLKHVSQGEKLNQLLRDCCGTVIIRDSLVRNDIESLISLDKVDAVATNYYEKTVGVSEEFPYTENAQSSTDAIMRIKRSIKALGIEINTFDSDIKFNELKKNSDGMVPCIVQDYRNGEVLMLAYMNEEAFNRTIETGVMTYYSRSRNELWVKGMTSGHFQYVREISVDCDSDTLLAKVLQIGAACHTGNRSCFYRKLVEHEYEDKNIYSILMNLYNVVVDRKEHPKEGSYTNYLFDKGIDKILKKCGEEATEMVIAAKNPNAEELKYEIADLMYHMTVLMVECGVDWEDIAKELSNR